MQPDIQTNYSVKRIAQKEISLFFSSAIAYLFLASFAAISLFIFFWGESFFARNIADVRPLFEWMPLLLIFLSATLTMRLWSEERRSGTLEHVLTQSVPLWHFVLGKFVGCVVLLVVALLITLPIPITVAVLGELDWGPVWAGYLATLLLGAAYLSIGLYVSAKSDNQIVSLISACAVCGAFYLIGTNTLTDFFGTQTGEYMRLLGTGSRFESITRGVIDLRDLYYYVSLIVIFLLLNTFTLERGRWVDSADNQQAQHQHKQWWSLAALIVLNVLVANVWLAQLNMLRVDVTQGKQYSISPATKNYLKQLQEPLLIRGYFSQKTHPLLAPLVPQMRDLINEYEIAGAGQVRVEFIDPIADAEAEKEANEKYGIRPVPFQVADRYQSAIVSSYFNIVIEYGDQHQVLAFNDLIEVKSNGVSDIDVMLRNPEYDLTHGIKKVLHSYQAGGNLFDTIKGDITFTGYFSEDQQLPKQLVAFKADIVEQLKKLQATSSNRFSYQFIDPLAKGGKVAEDIAQKYGFSPMATSIFSNDTFYFYMLLSNGKQTVQVPFSEIDNNQFERNLNASLKRFARGFTKNIALVTPPAPMNPYAQQFGMGQMAQGAKFEQLRNILSKDLNVQNEDLADGSVSGDADILVLAAPKSLDEKQLFAVDQFLMQGGTVIMATSPYSAKLAGGKLSLEPYNSGLQDWLKHFGYDIEQKLVLDRQSSAFPIPITRNVGGLQIQDLRMFEYPYFIDIREQGLAADNAITSALPQLTVPWASPIRVVQEKQQGRKLTKLLFSSEQSWLSASNNIMPKIEQGSAKAYAVEGETKRHLLALVSQGQFHSYFADKPSPLVKENKESKSKDSEQKGSENQATENQNTDKTEPTTQTEQPTVTLDRVIKRSAESARLILLSSNDMLNDQVFSFLSQGQQTQYLNNMQFVLNAIDWSLEDAGLLTIRARGHFNRTLPPMDRSEQQFWEYVNYSLVVVLIVVIAVITRIRNSRRKRYYQTLLSSNISKEGV